MLSHIDKIELPPFACGHEPSPISARDNGPPSLPPFPSGGGGGGGGGHRHYSRCRLF